MSKSKPVVDDRQLDMPFMRTAYDGFSDMVSEETSIYFRPPSEEEYSALQSFRDECDLNLIVARNDHAVFERFADRVAAGFYADLAAVPDYQDAQNFILEARSAFDDLPAELRKEFDNDPSKFLEFIDRGDRADFERLGLVQPLGQASFPDSNGSPVPDTTSIGGPDAV